MTLGDHAADLTFFAAAEDPHTEGAGPGLWHFLVIRDVVCRQIPVGRAPLTIGRMPPCDLVLDDTQASRAHARVHLAGDQLVVTDLGSTNGTFADGQRVIGSRTLEHGATLRIGTTLLAYERRTRRELEIAAALERDTREASSYVQSLLPEPVREGPVQTEWLFLPCAQLGGSGFGTGAAHGARVSMFMLGVAGHGTSAAMQSVAVMSVLRQRTLPDADFDDPGSVLERLSATAETVPSLPYTLWYGAFDPHTRELAYASAGHTPALLQVRGRDTLVQLATDGPAIGMARGHAFVTARIAVPPSAALVLLGDGVADALEQHGMDDPVAFLTGAVLEAADAGPPTPLRLHRTVRDACAGKALGEDFVALVVNMA